MNVCFHVLPIQTNNLLIIKNLFFIFSVTNLKYWGRCEPVISRTLQFLNDISVGYPFYYISDNADKQPNKYIHWPGIFLVYNFCTFLK